jgi:sucrose-6-phosphate hydrolase SacC (GH32 family)
MHWGHAVSRDLVHWDEVGDVLAPDQFGPMFSGSAVVDWKNTSGLGKDGKPPLVLIYTAAGNPTVQCIASSTDGRTFTKFAGNPVLKQITEGNRDPKVMWFEPTKKWVMVLYVTLPGNKHSVHFLTSPNLRNWSLASVIKGGMGENSFLAECPNFFELAVDGDSSKKKWVLAGANSEYEIGTFDGTKFSPETPKLQDQSGKEFYAPQIFSDIPPKDGRCIQIGWIRTETRGMPFNQSMTIPMELKLISTQDGPRLARSPVKELECLQAKSLDFGTLKLHPDGANPLAGIKSELVELRAEFEPSDTSKVIFNIRGATVIYDTKKQEVAVNGLGAPAPLRGRHQRLTIFCDRTELEVFASDGLTYVPMPFQAKADDLALGVEVLGGEVTMTTLDAYEFKSAWPKQGDAAR